MLVHLERDELKTIVMIGRKMQNLLDDVKHLLDEELAGDWRLVSIQTSTRGSRTSGAAQTKT